MLVRFPEHNVGDRHYRNVVVGGQLSTRLDSALRVNVSNIRLCQSVAAPPLDHHVRDILGLRAYGEMLRSDAVLIVAQMQDAKRPRVAVVNHVADAVRPDHPTRAVQEKTPVAASAILSGRRPQPALPQPSTHLGAVFIDLGPEPGNRFLVHRDSSRLALDRGRGAFNTAGPFSYSMDGVLSRGVATLLEAR